MLSNAKKETSAQGIGQRSTGPFSRADRNFGSARLLARIKAETEVSRQSAFPTFMRHQTVRATPAFFEVIVADLLVLKGLDPHIRAKLKGKPLVDLCCGDETSIEASKNIAAHYGARLEVVDLHLPANLVGEQAGIKGTKTDALTYVSSLPDNHANFMMCGIDGAVIDDDGYWQRLATAIEKKTVPGGIVMGMSSDLYKYLHFKTIDKGTVEGTYFVMEKDG